MGVKRMCACNGMVMQSPGLHRGLPLWPRPWPPVMGGVPCKTFGLSSRASSSGEPRCTIPLVSNRPLALRSPISRTAQLSLCHLPHASTTRFTRSAGIIRHMPFGAALPAPAKVHHAVNRSARRNHDPCAPELLGVHWCKLQYVCSVDHAHTQLATAVVAAGPCVPRRRHRHRVKAAAGHQLTRDLANTACGTRVNHRGCAESPRPRHHRPRRRGRPPRPLPPPPGGTCRMRWLPNSSGPPARARIVTKFVTTEREREREHTL